MQVHFVRWIRYIVLGQERNARGRVASNNPRQGRRPLKCQKNIPS